MNKLLLTIILKALQLATPQIREDLRKVVADMMSRALKTPNPWDDVFVGLLQLIVGKPNDAVVTPEEE